MPEPDKPNGLQTTARWIIPGAVVLFLTIVAPLLRPGLFVGDTVTSRMATVYALIHDGTWEIGRPASQPPNPFESATVDKVMVNDRLISSKPPLLPLLMTAEYFGMRQIAGYELDRKEDLRPILNVMIFTLCHLTLVLGLVFFAATVALFMDNPVRAAIPVALLALATPLPGYAQQLNNHTPAAAALMGALYFALALGTGKRAPTAWRFFALGFLSSLVFTIDMPVAIFAAAAGFWLFLKYPRQVSVWCLLGAALPLALHLGGLWFATGSVIPVQMRGDTYLFESSYWRNPLGIDALNEPRAVYLFHITVGRFGMLSLFPVLFVGLAGMIWLVFQKDRRDERLLAGLAGLAFIVLTAYYLKKTNNYGGASYGFRWYIGAVPVLMLLAIPIFKTIRNPLAWALLFLVSGVSLWSAWECLQAPWGLNHEWTCRLLFGPAV